MNEADEIPFIAIGANEWAQAPKLAAIIKCPRCGDLHKIESAEKINDDGTRSPSDLMQFYRCQGSSYFAGIRGRAV